MKYAQFSTYMLISTLSLWAAIELSSSNMSVAHAQAGRAAQTAVKNLSKLIQRTARQTKAPTRSVSRAKPPSVKKLQNGIEHLDNSQTRNLTRMVNGNPVAARAVETAVELPAKDQAKAVAWLADEARTMPGALRHIDELGPHALRAYSTHGLETGRMIGRYGDVGARAMDALSPQQLADLNAHAMKDLLKLPVEKQQGFLLNVQKHPEAMARMSVSLGKHEAELAKHGLTVAGALAGSVMLTQTKGGHVTLENGKEIIIHGIDGAVEVVDRVGKTVRGPLYIVAIVIGLVVAIFLLFKISPFLPRRRKTSP